MTTPHFTVGLEELSKEIIALPEPIRSKVIPYAWKINELLQESGDAGLYSLALVFECVKERVQSAP
jgi:hypothetical protein